MSLKVKQALIILAGFVVAGIMLLLGLWQMSSYQESTRDVSAERAAEPAVSLPDAVASDGVVQDIYGRHVFFTGQYLPEHEVIVGTDAAELRVATAMELEDGRYLTVVRGLADGAVPPAPEGDHDVTGIFLAPDTKADDPASVSADMASLRVQELAQTWPAPLIAGYVTLEEADAAAQGLSPAPVVLPEAEGSATHRGYALQWWVFAAGAIAFGFFGARGFAQDEAKRLAKLAAAEEAAVETQQDATIAP